MPSDLENDLFYFDLDLSRFAFPSDHMTIGMLRKQFPDLFDKPLSGGYGTQPTFFNGHNSHLEREPMVRTMLFLERAIAACAVGRAAGVPEWSFPGSQGGLEKVKSRLAGMYTQLGLASGKHTADEFIRDIEEQSHKLSPGLPPQ